MNCEKCGKPIPRGTPWPSWDNRSLCAACSLEVAAELVEITLPGDSLREISEAEQLGARLRAMIPK